MYLKAPLGADPLDHLRITKGPQCPQFRTVFCNLGAALCRRPSKLLDTAKAKPLGKAEGVLAVARPLKHGDLVDSGDPLEKKGSSKIMNCQCNELPTKAGGTVLWEGRLAILCVIFLNVCILCSYFNLLSWPHILVWVNSCSGNFVLWLTDLLSLTVDIAFL